MPGAARDGWPLGSMFVLNLIWSHNLYQSDINKRRLIIVSNSIPRSPFDPKRLGVTLIGILVSCNLAFDHSLINYTNDLRNWSKGACVALGREEPYYGSLIG